MAFFKQTPTLVSFTRDSTWQDVDAQDYGVPADADGVLLHIINDYAAGAYKGKVRKNGSTDDFGGSYDDISNAYHFWTFVGVDANGIFEAKSNNAVVKFYIVGYTVGVSWRTNGLALTPATGSWQDVDLSASCPNGTLAFFWRISTDGAAGINTRPNGSTDDRHQPVWRMGAMGDVCGLDENQIVEIYRGDANCYINLMGYATDKSAFNVNAPDKTPAVDYAYHDITGLGQDTVVAVFECKSNGGGYYHMRDDGASDDWDHRLHPGQAIALPGVTSQVCEGSCYAPADNPKFYLKATLESSKTIRHLYLSGGIDLAHERACYLLAEIGAARDRWGYLPGTLAFEKVRDLYLPGDIDAVFGRSGYLIVNLGALYGDSRYLRGAITVIERHVKPSIGAWFMRLSSVMKEVT